MATCTVVIDTYPTPLHISRRPPFYPQYYTPWEFSPFVRNDCQTSFLATNIPKTSCISILGVEVDLCQKHHHYTYLSRQDCMELGRTALISPTHLFLLPTTSSHIWKLSHPSLMVSHSIEAESSPNILPRV